MEEEEEGAEEGAGEEKEEEKDSLLSDESEFGNVPFCNTNTCKGVTRARTDTHTHPSSPQAER